MTLMMSWLVLLLVPLTCTRVLMPPQTSNEGSFNFFSKFDDMFGAKNFWETDTNLVARFPTSATTPRPTLKAQTFPPPNSGSSHSHSRAEEQVVLPVRAGNLWSQQTLPASSDPSSPEPFAAAQVSRQWNLQPSVHQHSPFVPFQSPDNFPTAGREEPPVPVVQGEGQRATKSSLPSTFQGDVPPFQASVSASPGVLINNQWNPPPVISDQVQDGGQMISPVIAQTSNLQPSTHQSVVNQPDLPLVDISDQQWDPKPPVAVLAQPPVFDPTWPAQPPVLDPTWPAQPPRPLLDPTWPAQPPVLDPTWSAQPPLLDPTWPAQPPLLDPTWPAQPPLLDPTWPAQPPRPLLDPAWSAQPPVSDPIWPAQPPLLDPTLPAQPPRPLLDPTWPAQPPVFDPTWSAQPPVSDPTWPAQPLLNSSEDQSNNLGALPSPNSLFSLPSPLPPPLMASDEDCYSEKGEVGTCATVFQCEQSGGYSSGLCHQGLDRLRVCCIFSSQCGYQTNHRTTYFRSPPSFPPTSCTNRVNLLPEVCQVRLDFLDFRVAPLIQGFCDPANRLLISTDHQRATVSMKELCGTLAIHADEDQLRTDLPHLYVHFDRDVRPGEPLIPNKNSPPHLSLEMMTNNYPASWNIRVSQITCDGAPLQAPPGCSQFYNSASGTISSLNLLDRQYPASTSLTACLARDNSACAVRYKLKQLQLGPSKTGGLGYGLVCRDYLKFLGEKTGVCGVGDGRDMVLPVKGPVGLTFRSDKFHLAGADVGYEVEFEYLYQCTSDTAFFRYPVAK